MAQIFTVRPNGSGLKQITISADFCGSPRWTSDNQHIVAYCMTAQQIMASRVTDPPAGSATQLVISAARH